MVFSGLHAVGVQEDDSFRGAASDAGGEPYGGGDGAGLAAGHREVGGEAGCCFTAGRTDCRVAFERDAGDSQASFQQFRIPDSGHYALRGYGGRVEAQEQQGEQEDSFHKQRFQ